MNRALPDVGPFQEQVSVKRTKVIELKSSYGLSDLRDITTTTGSATITNSNGEFKLATTANGSDSATLDTAERGRYIPGTGGDAGIGVRLETEPTGNQIAKWGYFDDNDGCYFGHDATGPFVAVLRGGSETKIRQSNWNVDRLDGTSRSGETWTIDKGYIYEVRYTWYGYGVIEFALYAPETDEENDQRRIVVHRFTPENTTSIQEPNLPIRTTIDNDGTAAAFNMFVAGRQYSVLGDFNPNRRITSERNLQATNIGTSIVPLISVRRKSSFETVSVKLAGFDSIVTEDAVFQIRLNGSLTGSTFSGITEHSTDETALESDTSATAITGGEVLWSGLVSAAGTGSNSEGFRGADALDLDFVQLQSVSLCVRTIATTGATIDSVLRLREEW